jgi:Ala-tRNA(Pro) deacylase
MPVNRLKTFLDENKVRYVTMSHSSAYTAQEIAAATHIPGKSMAKAVMAKLDDRMTMLVLPASYKVDLKLLRQAVGASKAQLATEGEFKEFFPDCETGAMPPFGNLYGLPVIVAESLKDAREIAFNAGSHTEVVKLGFADYERLVNPTVLKFSDRA